MQAGRNSALVKNSLLSSASSPTNAAASSLQADKILSLNRLSQPNRQSNRQLQNKVRRHSARLCGGISQRLLELGRMPMEMFRWLHYRYISSQFSLQIRRMIILSLPTPIHWWWKIQCSVMGKAMPICRLQQSRWFSNKRCGNSTLK